MSKNRDSLKMILLVSIFAVLGITIAFAALSTNLNIGTDLVKNDPGSSMWKIGFTGDYTIHEYGTSSTGRVCGEPTITESSISISEITLSKPEDNCTYQLTIKNSGNIDAVLQSVVTTPPNMWGGPSFCPPYDATETASSITTCKSTFFFSLHGSNDFREEPTLHTGTELAGGDSIDVYLIAYYIADSTNSESLSMPGPTFTLTWAQN